jgi:RNA polymerase sigma-70 factor (ECF subfamily)
VNTEENSLSKFIEIYENYKDMVFDTAMTYCDNYHTAQEISQEVFAECYVKKIHLEKEEKLHLWFKYTTRNKVIDYWRKIHKEDLYFEMEDADIPVQIKSSEDEYIQETTERERVEQGRFILKEMRKKNERWHEYILMKYFFGMKEKEIAEATDTSIDSVKSVVKRAKEWALKRSSENKDT